MIKARDLTAYLNPPGQSSVHVSEGNFIDIGENKFVGLVGESGSGKSQLALSLSGLNNDNYVPIHGEIDYTFTKEKSENISFHYSLGKRKKSYISLKESFKKNNIYGKYIGMMFQNPSDCFNPYWSIKQHFDEIKTKHNYESQQFNLFRNQVLEILNIPDILERSTYELSGGQKQRLMIALVLVQKPRLMIGDEIGTGIDLSIKRDIYNYLLEIKSSTLENLKDWSPSLLLISHDIGFTIKIVDELYIMYRGTIVQKITVNDGKGNSLSINELLDSNKYFLHPYTRALLSSVISRTYSINVDVPDLTIRNQNKCPFSNGCEHKMSTGECESDFPKRMIKNKDWVRCVRSESGINYNNIDLGDFDWVEGWEHNKDESDKIVLSVDFKGHKIRTGKSTFYIKPYKFKLKPNQILGLIGESGSGKTTFGKILASASGYIPNVPGTKIDYFDYDGLKHDYLNYKLRRKLSYPIQIIYQDPQFSLNLNMQVKDALQEAINIGKGKTRIKKSYLNKSIDEYSEYLGLQEVLSNRIDELSGGQKRRLGVGRVIAAQPRIIIADEPVASLDASIKNSIIKLLTWDEDKQFGFLKDKDGNWMDRAILFISHDISTIDRYCSQILVFRNGEVLELVKNRLGAGFDCDHEYTKKLNSDYEYFDLTHEYID